MARARNIKPGFFRNADLVELPMEARLLFIGIWTLADRAGRLEDRPKQIKMEIFPADNIDCDALIGMLAETGMLLRYAVDGKRYLQVTNFVKHQNPHRDEKASILPYECGHLAKVESTTKQHSASTVQAPCLPDADTVAIGLNPESRILNPETLRGEREAQQSPDGSPPPFLPEYREFIKTERPDLSPAVVWANFSDHYPADKCTAGAWKKWVRKEHVGKSGASGITAPPLASDPDSRASIETLGVALGLGRWDEGTHWSAYKARVQARSQVAA